MASRGERRMDEELSETPRLGLRRDRIEGEDEETAVGGIAGLVGRCEGLSLAGGVENGSFQIPGLAGGGSRRVVLTVGSGSSSENSVLQEESGGSMLLQGHGLYVTVRMWRHRASQASNAVQSRSSGIHGVKGRTDTGDREGVGVGGFGELGVVVAEGGGSGLAHGGVSKSCLFFNGEWVWNWRGGPARIELNVWGGVWDVGWNRRRRMGPKVTVRGEYEGSGGPPGPIG